MLNLFTLDTDHNVIIRPETLTLTPFKNVMAKHRKKEYGLIELAYVYFMADFRSDFDDLVKESEKSEKILETLHNSDKIKLDFITQEAIDFYTERQPSISFRHLKSMKKALVSLQDALDKIDLSIKVTNAITGGLEDVYDTMALSRINNVIKDSPKIIAAIKDMEKQVKAELQENTSHRGSGEKSIYEDE